MQQIRHLFDRIRFYENLSLRSTLNIFPNCIDNSNIMIQRGVTIVSELLISISTVFLMQSKSFLIMSLIVVTAVYCIFSEMHLLYLHHLMTTRLFYFVCAARIRGTSYFPSLSFLSYGQSFDDDGFIYWNLVVRLR